jgi:glycosyltransferase involved in cell wall biosynthesis
MIVATALIVMRTLVVIWLAARFRCRKPDDPAFAPPVSILIAAYNEEKVIAATLRALLITDYRGELEVIVVDDGSRDETAAEVESVAAHDSRVRLLRQHNRGKAQALRRALAAIRHGIVVFLDADTQFQPNTLRLLCSHSQTKKLVPYRATRKWATCARSSRAVRHSNTRAGSISIDALMIDGTA